MKLSSVVEFFNEDGCECVSFANEHAIETDALAKSYNRLDAEDYGVPRCLLDDYEESRMVNYSKYGICLVDFLKQNAS